MLSWSSHESDGAPDADLRAIAAGQGDPGVPLGETLVRFASAAASTRGDTTEMDAARRALIAATDAAFMVDAAAVAANFHMMTRLADGTGARYPAPRQDAMAATIALMGADTMASRR